MHRPSIMALLQKPPKDPPSCAREKNRNAEGLRHLFGAIADLSITGALLNLSSWIYFRGKTAFSISVWCRNYSVRQEQDCCVWNDRRKQSEDTRLLKEVLYVCTFTLTDTLTHIHKHTHISRNDHTLSWRNISFWASLYTRQHKDYSGVQLSCFDEELLFCLQE